METQTKSYQELAYFCSKMMQYINDPDFAAECERQASLATAGNVSGVEAIAQCLRNRLDYVGL